MKRTAKSSGAKTSRTETVGVRLEPKIRYLAEMAAREQQRTLSSFIDWAIRRALTPNAMRDGDEPTYGTSFPANVAPPLWMEGLWDVEEADRFYLLGAMRHDLMNIEEERRWKELTEGLSKITIDGFRRRWKAATPQAKKHSRAESIEGAN